MKKPVNQRALAAVAMCGAISNMAMNFFNG